MKSLALILVAGSALALPVAAGAAGNAESGKSKAQSCAACHGPEGKQPIGPDFPIIAGQHADYLRRALLDYQSGARANPIMKGLAESLSKQDIDDLAAYFSTQSSRLQTRR